MLDIAHGIRNVDELMYPNGLFKITCLANDVHHYLESYIPYTTYFSGIYYRSLYGKGSIPNELRYYHNATG